MRSGAGSHRRHLGPKGPCLVLVHLLSRLSVVSYVRAHDLGKTVRVVRLVGVLIKLQLEQG